MKFTNLAQNGRTTSQDVAFRFDTFFRGFFQNVGLIGDLSQLCIGATRVWAIGVCTLAQKRNCQERCDCCVLTLHGRQRNTSRLVDFALIRRKHEGNVRQARHNTVAGSGWRACGGQPQPRHGRVVRFFDAYWLRVYVGLIGNDGRLMSG